MSDIDATEIKAAVDSLGCSLGKLEKNQEVVGSGLKFMRKSSNASRLGRVSTEPADRGYLIGVSQSSGHTRRIFHEHHSTICRFTEDAVYVRKFSERYQADFSGSFDFLLMEISPILLQRLAEEDGGHADLRSSAGETDPVLSHMLRAVAPALGRSSEVSKVFLDHLGVAIGTHLIAHHSSTHHLVQRPLKALLSPSQLGRAKEILRNHLDGAISITEVARVCGLSQGYFIRAFRQMTGQTPHRWLLGQRVECARTLLVQSDLSLADVAIACGFSDQSHFTRVFARFAGTTPGTFRRASRI